MTDITLFRGDAGSTTLSLKVSELDDLPAEFTVRLTVKPSLDNDVTDSNAIIIKNYDFPSDFTLKDEGTANERYETALSWTETDTLHPKGTYYWNVRLRGNNDQFIRSADNGKFRIEVGSTQS